MVKVSVIIPTYNRPLSLKVAVESVIDQGLDDLEIIVVDDCSDEKNKEALSEVKKRDNRIDVIRNECNLGPAASRNRGIEASSGEFILFLDDDDLLLPHMLKEALEIIENDGLDVVTCRSEVRGAHLSTRQLMRYNLQQNDGLDLYHIESQPAEHIFLYTPQIHTFLIRRQALSEVRFPEDLSYGEDMMFWLLLSEKGLQFKKVGFTGVVYHLHTSSVSSRTAHSSKQELYFGLLQRLKIGVELKNMIYIKMAYLSFAQGKVSGLKWVAKALMLPICFVRHVAYYFRIL